MPRVCLSALSLASWTVLVVGTSSRGSSCFGLSGCLHIWLAKCLWCKGLWWWLTHAELYELLNLAGLWRGITVWRFEPSRFMELYLHELLNLADSWLVIFMTGRGFNCMSLCGPSTSWLASLVCLSEPRRFMTAFICTSFLGHSRFTTGFICVSFSI